MTDRERAKIVDEYGEDNRLCDLHKAVEERQKKRRELIQSWAATVPAEERVVFNGKLYELEVGPKASERTITRMDKLYALLGVKKFLSFCRIPLTVVDKEVPEDQHASFISSARTGSRSVKPILLRAAAVKR